jgi:1-acyl-sn-glycerol-3-phosphate acyltransferase
VRHFLRKLYATLVSYLLGYTLTAVGVLLGCLVAIVNLRGVIKVGCVVWGNLLFWILGRHVRVSGREHLRAGRAVLVVANHASMYDIPALMAALPGIAIMGRDYLTRIPALGRFLEVLHYVPIDTGSARSSREALSRAAREIRGGLSIAMGPEGTRTPTGRVQQLKRGFVAVLRESASDLLPVSISGTFALKPKGTLVMDPREQIRVAIGAPLASAGLLRMSDEEIMQAVRNRLQEMGENGQ